MITDYQTTHLSKLLENEQEFKECLEKLDNQSLVWEYKRYCNVFLTRSYYANGSLPCEPNGRSGKSLEELANDARKILEIVEEILIKRLK